MATTESGLLNNGSRDTLNDEYAVEVLPAILFLSLITLVGSIGNVLVIIVYRCNLTKVNNCFILVLAVIDLINCLTSVPGEILDLRFKYSFGESLFCPTMRLCEAFSHLSSASILIAISVDRFKKICKPFQKQTTLKAAAAAILTSFVLAFCMALPAAFINGKKTTIIDGVIVTDCSIADKYIGTSAPQIYNGVFFLLFICACVILIVMYILIWRRLRLQKAYRKKTEPNNAVRLKFHQDLSSDDILTSTTDQLDVTDSTNAAVQSTTNTGTRSTKTSGPLNTTKFQTVSCLVESTRPVVRLPITGSSDEEVSDSAANTGVMLPSSSATKVVSHSKVRKTRSLSVRTPSVDKTTVMMFLVTIAFVVSFLPYVVITTAHAVNKNVFRHLTGAQLAFYNLFLRFHFLNSALNPFIYSFCGVEFRKQLRKIFQTTCNRR